ncbi:hypothetical protein DFA_03747 [Cavenderia fasciculata]|uniref:Uncharacterized protein n=1 Tax=Cavenderia fasciculata TaxID=261658 RepID=F4Q0A5_CACFS|nr:uncharacterized protein DFA_03747 [Cavenderia fasciculata]EGG18256.1 hypothetical protein DFA_03747 [Cavenderia fasciculata]|eukprot:XP_004357079.1 hypothetical protein DFA_03747 [Cavenderia fasciculata]
MYQYVRDLLNGANTPEIKNDPYRLRAQRQDYVLYLEIITYNGTVHPYAAQMVTQMPQVLTVRDVLVEFDLSLSHYYSDVVNSAKPSTLPPLELVYSSIDEGSELVNIRMDPLVTNPPTIAPQPSTQPVQDSTKPPKVTLSPKENDQRYN